MASVRRQRVAEQMQEEISSLIAKGLKDPRIGFVTITSVDISADLKRAWVYFCTSGTDADRERSQQGLQSSSGYIRRMLGKRLRLRNIPEFEFKYDESLDRGNQIETILSEVREQEGWDDPERVRGSAEEVALAFIAGKRFLVTSHLNPDGDAIASMLAVRLLLESMGKEVVCYNPDPVPHNFMFLAGAADIENTTGEDSFDHTVVLDCSELNRCGPLPAEELRGKLVGIDHHLTVSPLGEARYLNPKASSIGEMLDKVLEHLPVEIDLDLAKCLYCSILTDTGSFRYSNTAPATLHLAARLVEIGVSPWDMTLKVYESQPVERVHLLAEVLQTLVVDPSGKHASITVTDEMFEKTGTSKDLIDGFINYPRGIDGVEVAIQFRQADINRYKVSFRSRGNVDVASIAQGFGGGGHRNAAGCELSGELNEVQKIIYQAIDRALAP